MIKEHNIQDYAEQTYSLTDLDNLSRLELGKLENSIVGTLIKRAHAFVSTYFGEANDEACYLAENENTPAATLRGLATFPAENVRRRVASNPSTPFEVLLKMQNGPQNSFLSDLDVAMHPNAPEEYLAASAATLNNEDAAELLERDDLPFSALDTLVYGRNLSYWSAADGNVNVDEYAKKKLVDKIVAFLSQEQVPWELLELIENSSSKSEIYAVLTHEDSDPRVRWEALDKLETMGVDINSLRDPVSGEVIPYNKFAGNELEMVDFDTLDNSPTNFRQ